MFFPFMIQAIFTAGNLRTCAAGHYYYKSSDFPVCPECERRRKVPNGLTSTLAAPARRALERLGVDSPAALSQYTRGEIAGLHGMGPAGLKRLEAALTDAGLTFKQ